MSRSETRSVNAPLEIERLERAGGVVLVISGECDSSNGHRITDHLDGVEGSLTLDTTGLTFLDSRGLMTLITCRDRAGTERFELCLISGGPVHRLLQLTGLDDEFNLTMGRFDG